MFHRFQSIDIPDTVQAGGKDYPAAVGREGGIVITISIRRKESSDFSVPSVNEDDAVFPAGIESGPTLVSGQFGDLYITIRVKPHKLFKREGYNILYTLPIDFITASLGGEADVPTIDGPVEMKIPDGIQSGEVLRLRGKGIKYNRGDRGDQLVEVKVETPRRVSRKARKLLEELKDEL